jgi:hypothetical protein
MLTNLIEDSLFKLKSYIEVDEFKGYDPIDIHNSFIPFQLLGHFPMVMASQINLRLPFNLRPFININKEYNAMAIGVLLRSYCILYKLYKKDEDLQRIEFFFNWIITNNSRTFQNYSWGNNFTWATPIKIVGKNYPNIVTTSIVAKAIFEYHELSNNPIALEVLESIGKYIVNDLPKYETDTELCFSYTDLMLECCFNASILGAEILAKLYSINKNDLLMNYVIKACNFILKHQKTNGSWNYSINLNNGVERKQIDFHQGYILESLFEIYNINEFMSSPLLGSIIKGNEFYLYNQFLPNGRSYWRYPKIYPIETHHHAVGIITSSLLSSINKKYLERSKKIAKFVISQMQNENGFFYYRKYKFYTNKISYLRWSNSWMLLGLSMLLQKKMELYDS